MNVERDLVAELGALLERVVAAAAAPPVPAAPLTAWQRYAGELRDLCRRVLEEADEETARAFFLFLLETAARHGRRAGGAS